MSVHSPFRQLLADARLGVEADRSAATDRPALTARLSATLHQDVLDRRLADGEDAAGDRALTTRAWQITRPGARERLAIWLDALLLDADGAERRGGSAVPVCAAEVAIARSEVLRIGERLRDRRPVRPRGVALTRRLLTDGNGPLYVPSGNDELWRQLRRAAVALD